MRTLLLLLSANALFGQQMPFIYVAGGPTNVRVLFQDHLGRLWVGGENDVACSDGSRFFSLSEFGLPQARDAESIAEDRDGGIWIGTDAGVYRFYQGALRQILKGFISSMVASFGVILASCGPGTGTRSRLRQGSLSSKAPQYS